MLHVSFSACVAIVVVYKCTYLQQVKTERERDRGEWGEGGISAHHFLYIQKGT